MKALGTVPNGEKQYCRQWAAGKCPRGTACPHLHKPDPKAAATVKPVTNTPHPPKAGPKYENRDKLGPPMGRKSDVNTLGYSKRQIFALGVLIDDDYNRDRHDSEDTWRTGSIASASASHRREHLRLNILAPHEYAPRVPPPRSPTPPASSAPEETKEPTPATPVAPATDAVPDLDPPETPLRYVPDPTDSKRPPQESSHNVPSWIESAITEYNQVTPQLVCIPHCMETKTSLRTRLSFPSLAGSLVALSALSLMRARTSPMVARVSCIFCT
jgi:hypothetical protein